MRLPYYKRKFKMLRMIDDYQGFFFHLEVLNVKHGMEILMAYYDAVPITVFLTEPGFDLNILLDSLPAKEIEVEFDMTTEMEMAFRTDIVNEINVLLAEAFGGYMEMDIARAKFIKFENKIKEDINVLLQSIVTSEAFIDYVYEHELSGELMFYSLSKLIIDLYNKTELDMNLITRSLEGISMEVEFLETIDMAMWIGLADQFANLEIYNFDGYHEVINSIVGIYYAMLIAFDLKIKDQIEITMKQWILYTLKNWDYNTLTSVDNKTLKEMSEEIVS